MISPRAASVLAVFSLLSTSGIALAGGAYVPGAGPHAQARAGAFVARADDTTAMTHNPAGLAKLSGTHISLGSNFITMNLEFTRFGRYEAPESGSSPSYVGAAFPTVKNRGRPTLGIGSLAAIPWMGLSTDLGKPHWPVRFGLGMVLPQAYGSRGFEERVSVQGADLAPGPQRYDVIEQDAALINPSLAIAYSPWDFLDVGVRLSWGLGRIKGTRAAWSVTNYPEFEGADSTFASDELKDDFVPNFGLGVLVRPADNWEIGAAYSSQVEINAEGTGSSMQGDLGVVDINLVPVADDRARCATGGTEEKLKTCVALQLARHASIGARYIGRRADSSEKYDVELDVRWEDWSTARDVFVILDAADTVTNTDLNETVSRHGFKDVYSLRLGGSYTHLVGDNKLIFRLGQAFDTAAAPKSWTRADLDGKARWTSAGGVAFEGSSFRVELGGGYVYEPDVTVDQCKPPDGPSNVDQGCGPMGEIPVRDRTAPDPLQPKVPAISQFESPYNAGEYKSSYLLMSLGFHYWF